MAVTSKPNKKQNRVIQFLSKEYKYENLILAILAIFAIVLGALIVAEILQVSPDFFLIGGFPKVFAWILISLGVVSLLLVLWPFYRPSLVELRHVTGSKRSEFISNVVVVLIFVLFLVGVFILYDLGIGAFIKWVS
ncbi:MAG TPA: preprotein translocase subunit SecE [Bacilli bacterium]|jgi:preprotein translocase SecE subunit|nr:preprotein translocase subunit SecE [Bacilli bacterium]